MAKAKLNKCKSMKWHGTDETSTNFAVLVLASIGEQDFSCHIRSSSSHQSEVAITGDLRLRSTSGKCKLRTRDITTSGIDPNVFHQALHSQQQSRNIFRICYPNDQWQFSLNERKNLKKKKETE